MQISELERAAMNGDQMPDGLCLEDQVYFQGLAYLYGRFRAGFITRERGSEEKGKMKHKWSEAKKMDEFSSKLSKRTAEMWKLIEGAQSRYRKERTLEAADALSNSLDGRLQGDDFT